MEESEEEVRRTVKAKAKVLKQKAADMENEVEGTKGMERLGKVVKEPRGPKEIIQDARMGCKVRILNFETIKLPH